MHLVALDSDIDFAGWRAAARRLALGHVKPAEVSWTVRGDEPELFAPAALPPPPAVPEASFNVPAKFVELAQNVILHSDPQRFALLYRVLWRLRANHEFLQLASDPDVAQLSTLARAVRRDCHKMKAFVRFREIGREPNNRFVAWFEPAHHIVEATAPFFARRFADMAWSILTPEVCAHWDGHSVMFTPGVSQAEAPSEDRLEETWLTYYASIFNPARLKVKAMQAEMPKRYWRNLPEAALIKPLIAQAGRATGAMIDTAATEPKTSMQRREPPMKHRATTDHDDNAGAASLAALREQAADCRACPLWKDATQTVFGEGPHHASVMLVGEQPGDKEDLAGQPFVGPAGQMLDRALRDAGIDRGKVYVTNAVKHFKFVPRGKIRLHQKPTTPEIRACRPWYERELAAVRPALVVALGATAAQSVLGKITPINKTRGRLIDTEGEAEHPVQVLVTVHPSYLLRLPDEDAKAREYDRFVDDLKIVAKYLKRKDAA